MGKMKLSTASKVVFAIGLFPALWVGTIMWSQAWHDTFGGERAYPLWIIMCFCFSWFAVTLSPFMLVVLIIEVGRVLIKKLKANKLQTRPFRLKRK